jgi:acyl dehydratase
VSPQDQIGRDLGSFIFDVERAQLRLFAKVTGERRPMYTDPQAARAAGYRDLPAPPTFAFTIGMKPDDPFEMLSAIGGDLARLLHGEQSFEYVKPICAGDRVRVRRQIVDAYQKKGGALTFFVVGVQYEDADTAEPFCSARQVLVVRAPEPDNA